MTLLGQLSLLNFDNFFDLINTFGDETAPDAEAGRREMRDLLVTHDYNACGNEYGVYALMAMFPREM